ncbi:MAG: YigZ family protein [Campylobacteraceae bacterium]|nr:YigZ family protein [Campylobacteraceae bacterium]
MQTVDRISHAEYEVKKSNFLAFLTPFSEFEKQRELLKNAHPKANHIVWAYRVLNEFEQIVENQSDDGEPKGTSGPPVLNVLRGAELVNCAVLIVRYFGGIKLGTGGLVRAYSGACNEVINASNLLPYEKLLLIKVCIPYTLLQRCEHFFKSHDFAEAKKDFDSDGVVCTFELSQKQKDILEEFAKEYEYAGLKLFMI